MAINALYVYMNLPSYLRTHSKKISVWFTDFSLVCTRQSSAFAKALVHRFRIEFRCQATRTDNRQRPVTEGRPKLLQPPDFSSLLKLQSGL